MIGPIERMMTLVKKLADNPLESASMDQQYLEDDKVGTSRAPCHFESHQRSTQDMKNDGYETALLETTLERVGSTLKVYAHVEIVLDGCYNWARASAAPGQRGPGGAQRLRRRSLLPRLQPAALYWHAVTRDDHQHHHTRDRTGESRILNQYCTVQL